MNRTTAAQIEPKVSHSVVAWPDVALMGPWKNYAIPLDDPSVWMASPEKKRVIKTHCDWDWLPYSPDARYVIVIRDPKDVFVSSYFFFVKNGSASASLCRNPGESQPP